jgi:hypothetical protein
VVNNSQQEHPDHDRLMAFGLGQLGQDEQAEVERHVAGCHVCCEALREVPDDALLARLRHALPATRPDSPSATPTVLATDAAVPRELADHSRYRVLKLLGSGGMGAVYQAEHRLMERMVALKVIRRALTDDPAAAERFRREVRAAGRLAHPNIVAAHDADQAGDLHFLVMEYVAGVSLDRLSEDRCPSAGRARVPARWPRDSSTPTSAAWCIVISSPKT